MKYEEIKVHKIKTAEMYVNAWYIMQEEFPDHRDTDLLSEYEWILVATIEQNQPLIRGKKQKLIGVITANKYIPKKALLCDIVVSPGYRSKGVGIKMLKEMGIMLRQQGYTHLMGFTPKKNTEALNTYKRVHTHQEEMIITSSELDVSIPHIEQLEAKLKYRDKRTKRQSRR